MNGMKIAIDPGNGAAAGVASLLFEKMGAEVKTINNEPDGRFPNRPSEPSAKNLKGLSEMIENGNFDFGIGFDGDADRCVFVDNKGSVVKTEKSGLIMAKNILTKDEGPVLVGVPCSKIVEEELKEDGVEVIWIRVGDVFVCELLKKHNAVFAMESSAHFFAPTLTEYFFDFCAYSNYSSSINQKVFNHTNNGIQARLIFYHPSEITMVFMHFRLTT